MKKFLLTLLVIGLVAGFFASKVIGQEVTKSGPIIELTAISTAFTYTESSDIYGDGSGARVKGIWYAPSTGDTGDVLIIRDGSTSGPKIVHWRTIDYTDARYIDLGGAKIKPFILYSECSISTGHTLTFILQK